MLKKNLILLFFTISIISFAQNNTNTPYSLFGLGVENKTATGGLTGLGNTGIAQKNENEINIYNPANLGNIVQKSFLYEIGVNGLYSTLKNDGLSQSSGTANLSHVAIAFPIKKGWGMSLGLLPYTKVGYNIDVENPIEGSTETYITRITGEGGLNKFYLSSGMSITERLSLGLDFSVLFGSIEQESLIYSESSVSISDLNNYNGVKLKTGLQYTFGKIGSKETTFGATIELPTSLNGSQTRNTYKTSINGTEIVVDEDAESNLNNFELPFSYGFGITSVLNEKFTTSFDYKKLLWNNTNQQQNNESYVDQSIYGLGLEYKPKQKNFTYWNKVKYRFGMNYSTGFLNISNQQVDSYFASVGLGLPIGKNDSTNFNISYSYGKEGTLQNNLVQENFHKLTVNLNFVGKWFKKKKIF